MKTFNEQLFEKYTRHLIRTQAYTATLQRDIIKIMKQGEPEFEKVVFYYTQMLSDTQPNTERHTNFSEKFKRELTQLVKKNYQAITKLLEEEMIEFSVMQSEAKKKMLDDSMPEEVDDLQIEPISKTDARRLVFQADILDGNSIDAWMVLLQAATVNRIIKTAMNSLRAGRTPKQALLLVKQQAFRRARNGLKNFITTTTSSITWHSQNRTKIGKNKKFLSQEIYRATLDSRTTPQCQGYDGAVYEIGKGPIPPLHYGCRSIRVPYINPEIIGKRPANPVTLDMLAREYAADKGIINIRLASDLKGRQTDFRKYARKRRRELVGPVPNTVTYTEFLRGQSNEFQEEVLGKRRAKIFRDNPSQTIDKFVNRAGQYYTLEELKQRFNNDTD